jgi:hypothetical protein
MASKITSVQYSISMQQLKEEAYRYDFDGHPTDYEV